jgi:hypothetical protein
VEAIMTKPASTPILAAISTLPVIAAYTLLVALSGSVQAATASFNGPSGAACIGGCSTTADFMIFGEGGGSGIISGGANVSLPPFDGSNLSSFDLTVLGPGMDRPRGIEADTNDPFGLPPDSDCTNPAGCTQLFSIVPGQYNGAVISFDASLSVSGAAVVDSPAFLVTVTLPPGLSFNAPAPIPLQAALPLFATSLGGLGLLGWRRKRKARAGMT